MNTQNSTPLGFSWDPSVLPQINPGSTRRALAIYLQQLTSFVWDAAKLENNPFTFVEVQTLPNSFIYSVPEYIKPITIFH